MKLARALACLALLSGAALVIEWHYGRQLARYRAEGGVVPPYASDRSPEQLAELRARIERLEQLPEEAANGPFDPELGWNNLPGTRRDGGLSTCTSSIGARGSEEVGESPPAGARRVLCLGDSFTYGSEVEDGEDWPSVIGQREPRLEMINLGVGGWSLDQAYLRWQAVGRELAPDVVVVGFFVGSIGRHVNRFRPLLYPQDPNPLVKPRFRLEDEELVLVPQPYTSRLEALRALEANTLLGTLEPHEYWAGDAPVLAWSNLSRVLACRRADVRRQVPVLWRDVEGEPFRVTLALMERLTQDVRETGGEVVTLIFPAKEDWIYDLSEGWKAAVYWSRLRSALDERHVPYIDLFPVLRGAGAAEELYREVHLSPAGNVLVAGEVEAWLEGILELDR